MMHNDAQCKIHTNTGFLPGSFYQSNSVLMIRVILSLTSRVGSCVESRQEGGVVRETEYMDLCHHDNNQTAT